jgi:ectoine hydroxylase-related dioxygenase (phytanoyl-CoA dioxygenase family)
MSSTLEHYLSIGDTFTDEALADFESNGYVVLHGVLSANEVANISKTLTLISNLEVDLDTNQFHTTDPKNRRVWNLLGKSRVFDNLITSELITSAMNRVFARDTRHKKYFLSSLQGVLLQPGGVAQKMHIDTPVPEPIPPWIIKANTIWLLDAFTSNNGATEVVPGSHKSGKKPPPEILDMEQPIVKLTAPAGSVIITHGALWHRGGENSSTGIRRVLLGSFAASFAREISTEEDSLRSIPSTVIHSLDPKLLEILGYSHGLKDSLFF